MTAPENRVQIKVMGQRFETTAEVLHAYCTVLSQALSRGELNNTTPNGYPFTVEQTSEMSLITFPPTAQPVMKNDYVGAIMVLLRKLLKAEQTQTAKPRLSTRWDELTYEQQHSFAEVVIAFGVTPLMGTHSVPTATKEEVHHAADEQPTGAAAAHPSCGDHDLIMSTVSCVMCGTQEHGTENCKYAPPKK